MTIQLLINRNAKQTIRKHLKKEKHLNTLEEYMFVDSWLNERGTVKCYMNRDDETIYSFALLSKMDYDPEEKHTNPFILNFIYTSPKHRGNHHAYDLIIHLKEREQMTAICSNSISEHLFEKAGFSSGEYMRMYRYP